jgi:amino acid permease
MQHGVGAVDLETVAAIPFLVVFLGLLVAGRTQALAGEYGSEPILRFQVWQIVLALLVSLISASQLPTVAKVVAVVAATGALAVSVVKARREHEADDLHF